MTMGTIQSKESYTFAFTNGDENILAKTNTIASKQLPIKRSKSAQVLPITPVKRQTSAGMIKIASFSGGSPKRCIKSSSQVPWLVKDATFVGTNLDDFVLGRVIGTGLMGTVRIVKLKNSLGYVALKSIRKEYIHRHKEHRHVENEKLVLTRLRSEFCVKLFGTFQDSNCVYFIEELAIGGELFRRLSNKDHFKPNTAKFYVTEICCALAHMHERNIVYRDLKPENVMLDEDGHCKLVDFGFSIILQEEDARMHTGCGTPAYLSPEQLNGKFTNGYSRIVDWWSFGVLVYELLTGKTPFCRRHTDTPYEIYLRVLTNRIWFPFGFDSAAKELVRQLCHCDVTQRVCTASAVMQHPYFGHLDWQAVRAKRLVVPFVPKIKRDIPGDAYYFDDYGAGAGSDCDVATPQDMQFHFDDF